MTEPIHPRDWPSYWLMRYELERQVRACTADNPAAGNGLVAFLVEHCFGCGIQITGDDGLCPACHLCRRWRLN